MPLPATLLEAIASPGGGQLAIVIGAGCSFEDPTAMPLAVKLSEDTHRQLVLNGVLAEGECPEPWNLAELASLVFDKTGSQNDLVSKFPINEMKTATPNKGYLLLAALMSENAVSHVLSLNFDLAVQTAIAQLGLGSKISIVDCSGQQVAAVPTLVHLHGCINSQSDELILRTEVMDDDWKESWEELVSTQILSAPTILFAGLGSAAPVLSQTLTILDEYMGGNKQTFQVDVSSYDENQLAQELSIEQDSFIQSPWCAFMADISFRLFEEQIHNLSVNSRNVVIANAGSAQMLERIDVVTGKMREAGFLGLGKHRAHLCVDGKARYKPYGDVPDQLYVDPMLTLSNVCEELLCDFVPLPNGIWEILQDGKRLGTAMLASGGGAYRLSALETKIRGISERFANEMGAEPSFVLVGGTVPGVNSGPANDLIEPDHVEDIIHGPGPALIMDTSAVDLNDNIARKLGVA